MYTRVSQYCYEGLTHVTLWSYYCGNSVSVLISHLIDNTLCVVFVEVEDDLKLQYVDQKVEIFILTHESENLSKESKILGRPNVHC